MCLENQCFGSKGKGRSLFDIGKLIGIADKLLQPGNLEKISKIMGQGAGILGALNGLSSGGGEQAGTGS